MNEEHTWTGNSEVDAAIVMLDRIDCSPEDDSRVDEVEATLRRQHARIQELEAMLEAVGAGGVFWAAGYGGLRRQIQSAGDIDHNDLKLAAMAKKPQADALDAERLDWLIEQGCHHGVVYEGLDKSFWIVWLDGHDAHKDKHQIGRYHTARVAIDAAIAAAKENK